MYQVCIQVAATVGCPCRGIEIVPERYEASMDLIKAFDEVLEKVSRLFVCLLACF